MFRLLYAESIREGGQSYVFIWWPRSTFTFCISRFPFCRFPFASFLRRFTLSRFQFCVSFPVSFEDLFGCVCLYRFAFHASRAFLVSRFSFHIYRFAFRYSRRPSPDTRRFHTARTSSQTDGRIRLARRKER